MNLIRFALIAMAALTLAACRPGSAASIEYSPPEVVRVLDFAPDPATESPYEQAIGAYWDGRLVDGTNIGLAGPGYIKIFRERDTGWATYDLITVIRKGVEKLMAASPNQEPIQIGDIGLRGGGPIGGHSSHQNGLDVDIRLLSKDHHVQSDGINTGFDEDFVVRGKLTSNFDLRRNWLLIKSFVATGRVERIFIDNVIKQALCRFVKSNGEISKYGGALRRLRHVANHIDHLHLRATCPQNSPRCEVSDPLPSGTGCL